MTHLACITRPTCSSTKQTLILDQDTGQDSLFWGGQTPTQPSEAWNQVNKGGGAVAERLGQVGPELVAQREQVVSNEHAVVVVDSCQMGKLQQVLPAGGTDGPVSL